MEQDKEAQEWIESILGAKFPPGQPYEDVIRDGTILCQVINKLAPGSVPKINTSGGQFKFMENINKWVLEAWDKISRFIHLLEFQTLSKDT